MKFAALDFETANSERASACALGIVLVDSGRIISERSWLIHPPTLHFHWRNIEIHGITQDDVRGKPKFPELWPEISGFLGDYPWLSHNASFDMSVMRATFDEYDMAYPETDYFCTMVFGRRMWPDLPDHKLKTIADKLGIAFRHHDPTEDARACARIAMHQGEQKNACSLWELAEKLNARSGKLYPGGYDSCGLSKARNNARCGKIARKKKSSA